MQMLRRSVLCYDEGDYEDVWMDNDNEDDEEPEWEWNDEAIKLTRAKYLHICLHIIIFAHLSVLLLLLRCR